MACDQSLNCLFIFNKYMSMLVTNIFLSVESWLFFSSYISVLIYELRAQKNCVKTHFF